MMFTRFRNVWRFTLCGLNVVRVFSDFNKGVEWAFTLKIAAACAAEMEK